MSEDEEEHSGCGKTSERRRAIKSISYQAPREITRLEVRKTREIFVFFQKFHGGSFLLTLSLILTEYNTAYDHERSMVQEDEKEEKGEENEGCKREDERRVEKKGKTSEEGLEGRTEGCPQRKRPSGDVTLIPPGRAYKMAAGVPFLPCYSYGVGFRLSRSLCLRYMRIWAAAVTRVGSLHKSLNRRVAAAFPPASASMDAERRRVARAEGIELSTELEGATPKDKLAA
uniref:Uncharacterized protein n=1 Tax=Vespula pensylvanica TaxID=30213 RepID=A0A834PFU4_VESPE|nr:hypothetical protein H0235_001126 [Vespula pensylvanica]